MLRRKSTLNKSQIEDQKQHLSQSSSESTDQSSSSDSDACEELGRNTQPLTQDTKKYTQAQRQKLAEMKWDTDFQVYDINADFDSNQSQHFSDLEKMTQIKEKNWRCGKVIWTTATQLFYTSLYIVILVTRFNQPLAHDYNTTLIKVFENHTISIWPVTGIRVDELANSNELAVWIDSILGLMYIKKGVDVENKETLKTY